MNMFRRLLSLLVVQMSLVACASVAVTTEDDLQVVTARAQRRWDLLLASDIGQAYGFLSPGSRAMRSLEQYKGSIKLGLWRTAKVDSAECSAIRCTVNVMVGYVYQGKASGKVEGESLLQEIWIKENGSWWLVPRQ